MEKLYVEKERCIGCGACVNIASDYFDFDDDGKSQVISNENIDSEVVNVAIESCPTGAIEIKENDVCECEDCDCGEDCHCDPCECENCHCGE